MNIKPFRYGAVLKITRQDTLSNIEKQFSMMRDCGMNTAVVWPAFFWWEEKKEGYPYNTGKEILKIAEKYNVGVIMELAGQLTVCEYIPDFEMKEEYYAIQEDGSRELGQTSYGFLNYFHPEVSRLITKRFYDAAVSYRDYPALLGYDIFNETMFRSFDKYTLAEFRVWLKEKYGTVEKLNEVWERTYTDFEQVGFEHWKWMSIVPESDLFAFRKAAIGRFMKNWKKAICEADNKHLVVADNIHSMVSPNVHYERPQDDFDLKEVVGEIGMSFYPKQVSGTMEDYLRWECLDAYYAASKREGFYIAEMQTHTQAIYNPTTAVHPYELKRWCMEAYAAGAKGLIFWKWRPFNKGNQTFSRGIVDYKDRPTVRYDMAKAFSELVGAYGTLTPVRSKVAIVFDPVCDDYQRRLTDNYPVEQNIYLSSIAGAYKAFYDAGIRCDIIRMEDMKNYETVILTNQLIIDEMHAAMIEAYVVMGGRVIADGRFGVIDETSLMNETVPGGKLNSIIGEEFLDVDVANEEFEYEGIRLPACYSRDIVRITGGKAVSYFKDGSPAVVENTHGKGKIFTVNTHLFYGYYKNNCPETVEFVKSFKVDTRLTVEGDVKVRVSENAEKVVFFIFNYADNPVAAHVALEDNGKRIEFFEEIKGNDSIVVERDKDHE